MADALRRAIAALDAHGQAAPRTGLIVCCGSVFVAADMREALAKLKPTLFATGVWVFEAASEPALLM